MKIKITEKVESKWKMRRQHRSDLRSVTEWKTAIIDSEDPDAIKGLIHGFSNCRWSSADLDEALCVLVGFAQDSGPMRRDPESAREDIGRDAFYALCSLGRNIDLFSVKELPRFATSVTSLFTFDGLFPHKFSALFLPATSIHPNDLMPTHRVDTGKKFLRFFVGCVFSRWKQVVSNPQLLEWVLVTAAHLGTLGTEIATRLFHEDVDCWADHVRKGVRHVLNKERKRFNIFNEGVGEDDLARWAFRAHNTALHQLGGVLATLSYYRLKS